MSKHTPGPWRIVDREVMEDGTVYPRHIVGGGRDLTVCLLEHSRIATLAVADPDGLYASDRMVEAEGDIRSKASNARLIAAAPDLLEKSKAAVAAMTEFRTVGEIDMDKLNRACRELAAVIAQAEGE